MVKDKLDDYLARNRNPFQLFEDKRNVDYFIEVLVDSDFGQADLFDFRLAPSEILQEMRVLYERGRLYRRWTQVMNGKSRDLAVPSKYLDEFLKRYINPAIKKRKIHLQSHGGEDGWTPKRSLETHLPLRSVVSFDLESAFNNAGIGNVFVFFYDMFANCDEQHRIDFAGFVSTLATMAYEDKRGLPQGALRIARLYLIEFYARLTKH